MKLLQRPFRIFKKFLAWETVRQPWHGIRSLPHMEEKV